MSAIQGAHPCWIMDSRFSSQPESVPRLDRASVIALVLLLHGGLCLAWMMQPEQPAVVLKEMSVTLAMQQPEVAQPQVSPQPPSPSPPPKPQPRIERAELPLPKQPVQEVDESATQPAPVAVPVAAPVAAPPVTTEAPAVSAAPEVDSEPDYTANYLNNPRPPYPRVARRMGYHGKVMINVEVLADGNVGQALLYASSGYQVLDNAALQAVKGWHFTPARQAGRAVTKWFIVPINFTLEDNKA